MRILVVEDEPKMGELIRRVLTSERHVVDLAADAVSALGLAAPGGEPYDVLVLDRMLPDLDGLELLRVLRSRGVRHAGPRPHRARRRRGAGGRPRRGRRRLSAASRSRSPS